MARYVALRDRRLEGGVPARPALLIVNTDEKTSLTAAFRAIGAAARGGKIDTMFILCHGFAGENTSAGVSVDAGGMGLELGRSSSSPALPRSSRTYAVAGADVLRAPRLACLLSRSGGALLALGTLSAACARDPAASLPERNVAAAQSSAEDGAQAAAARDAATSLAQPEEPEATGPSKAQSDGAVVDAAVVARPKRPKNAKLRTIHPLSPTRGDCLEMVSFCGGQPRRCTSSPVHVACGEEVEVKSRKEWLRCECP